MSRRPRWWPKKGCPTTHLLHTGGGCGMDESMVEGGLILARHGYYCDETFENAKGETYTVFTTPDRHSGKGKDGVPSCPRDLKALLALPGVAPVYIDPAENRRRQNEAMKFWMRQRREEGPPELEPWRVNKRKRAIRKAIERRSRRTGVEIPIPPQYLLPDVEEEPGLIDAIKALVRKKHGRPRRKKNGKIISFPRKPRRR